MPSDIESLLAKIAVAKETYRQSRVNQTTSMPSPQFANLTKTMYESFLGDKSPGRGYIQIRYPGTPKAPKPFKFLGDILMGKSTTDLMDIPINTAQLRRISEKRHHLIGQLRETEAYKDANPEIKGLLEKGLLDSSVRAGRIMAPDYIRYNRHHPALSWTVNTLRDLGASASEIGTSILTYGPGKKELGDKNVSTLNVSRKIVDTTFIRPLTIAYSAIGWVLGLEPHAWEKIKAAATEGWLDSWELDPKYVSDLGEWLRNAKGDEWISKHPYAYITAKVLTPGPEIGIGGISAISRYERGYYISKVRWSSMMRRAVEGVSGEAEKAAAVAKVDSIAEKFLDTMSDLRERFGGRLRGVRISGSGDKVLVANNVDKVTLSAADAGILREGYKAISGREAPVDVSKLIHTSNDLYEKFTVPGGPKLTLRLIGPPGKSIAKAILGKTRIKRWLGGTSVNRFIDNILENEVVLGTANAWGARLFGKRVPLASPLASRILGNKIVLWANDMLRSPFISAKSLLAARRVGKKLTRVFNAYSNLFSTYWPNFTNEQVKAVTDYWSGNIDLQGLSNVLKGDTKAVNTVADLRGLFHSDIIDETVKYLDFKPDNPTGLYLALQKDHNAFNNLSAKDKALFASVNETMNNFSNIVRDEQLIKDFDKDYGLPIQLTPKGRTELLNVLKVLKSTGATNRGIAEELSAVLTKKGKSVDSIARALRISEAGYYGLERSLLREYARIRYNGNVASMITDLGINNFETDVPTLIYSYASFIGKARNSIPILRSLLFQMPTRYIDRLASLKLRDFPFETVGIKAPKSIRKYVSNLTKEQKVNLLLLQLRDTGLFDNVMDVRPSSEPAVSTTPEVTSPPQTPVAEGESAKGSPDTAYASGKEGLNVFVGNRGEQVAPPKPEVSVPPRSEETVPSEVKPEPTPAQEVDITSTEELYSNIGNTGTIKIGKNVYSVSSTFVQEGGKVSLAKQLTDNRTGSSVIVSDTGTLSGDTEAASSIVGHIVDTTPEPGGEVGVVKTINLDSVDSPEPSQGDNIPTTTRRAPREVKESVPVEEEEVKSSGNLERLSPSDKSFRNDEFVRTGRERERSAVYVPTYTGTRVSMRVISAPSLERGEIEDLVNVDGNRYSDTISIQTSEITRYLEGHPELGDIEVIRNKGRIINGNFNVGHLEPGDKEAIITYTQNNRYLIVGTPQDRGIIIYKPKDPSNGELELKRILTDLFGEDYVSSASVDDFNKRLQKIFTPYTTVNDLLNKYSGDIIGRAGIRLSGSQTPRGAITGTLKRELGDLYSYIFDKNDNIRDDLTVLFVPDDNKDFDGLTLHNSRVEKLYNVISGNKIYGKVKDRIAGKVAKVWLSGSIDIGGGTHVFVKTSSQHGDMNLFRQIAKDHGLSEIPHLIIFESAEKIANFKNMERTSGGGVVGHFSGDNLGMSNVFGTPRPWGLDSRQRTAVGVVSGDGTVIPTNLMRRTMRYTSMYLKYLMNNIIKRLDYTTAVREIARNLNPGDIESKDYNMLRAGLPPLHPALSNLSNRVAVRTFLHAASTVHSDGGLAPLRPAFIYEGGKFVPNKVRLGNDVVSLSGYGAILPHSDIARGYSVGDYISMQRNPIQGRAGSQVFRVEGFYPSEYGNVISVHSDRVKQDFQGDYDIDEVQYKRLNGEKDYGAYAWWASEGIFNEMLGKVTDPNIRRDMLEIQGNHNKYYPVEVEGENRYKGTSYYSNYGSGVRDVDSIVNNAIQRIVSKDSLAYAINRFSTLNELVANRMSIEIVIGNRKYVISHDKLNLDKQIPHLMQMIQQAADSNPVQVINNDTIFSAVIGMYPDNIDDSVTLDIMNRNGYKKIPASDFQSLKQVINYAIIPYGDISGALENGTIKDLRKSLKIWQSSRGVEVNRVKAYSWYDREGRRHSVTWRLLSDSKDSPLMTTFNTVSYNDLYPDKTPTRDISSVFYTGTANAYRINSQVSKRFLSNVSVSNEIASKVQLADKAWSDLFRPPEQVEHIVISGRREVGQLITLGDDPRIVSTNRLGIYLGADINDVKKEGKYTIVSVDNPDPLNYVPPNDERWQKYYRVLASVIRDTSIDADGNIDYPSLVATIKEMLGNRELPSARYSRRNYNALVRQHAMYLISPNMVSIDPGLDSMIRNIVTSIIRKYGDEYNNVARTLSVANTYNINDLVTNTFTGNVKFHGKSVSNYTIESAYKSLVLNGSETGEPSVVLSLPASNTERVKYGGLDVLVGDSVKGLGSGDIVKLGDVYVRVSGSPAMVTDSNYQAVLARSVFPRVNKGDSYVKFKYLDLSDSARELWQLWADNNRAEADRIVSDIGNTKIEGTVDPNLISGFRKFIAGHEGGGMTPGMRGMKRTGSSILYTPEYEKVLEFFASNEYSKLVDSKLRRLVGEEPSINTWLRSHKLLYSVLSAVGKVGNYFKALGAGGMVLTGLPFHEMSLLSNAELLRWESDWGLTVDYLLNMFTLKHPNLVRDADSIPVLRKRIFRDGDVSVEFESKATGIKYNSRELFNAFWDHNEGLESTFASELSLSGANDQVDVLEPSFRDAIRFLPKHKSYLSYADSILDRIKARALSSDVTNGSEVVKLYKDAIGKFIDDLDYDGLRSRLKAIRYKTKTRSFPALTNKQISALSDPSTRLPGSLVKEVARKLGVSIKNVGRKTSTFRKYFGVLLEPNHILYTINKHLASSIDLDAKQMLFLHLVNGGMDLDSAAELAGKALIDYSELSHIGRFLATYVPFYNWNTKIIKRYISLLATHPHSFRRIFLLMDAFNIDGDDEGGPTILGKKGWRLPIFEVPGELNNLANSIVIAFNQGRLSGRGGLEESLLSVANPLMLTPVPTEGISAPFGGLRSMYEGSEGKMIYTQKENRYRRGLYNTIEKLYANAIYRPILRLWGVRKEGGRWTVDMDKYNSFRVAMFASGILGSSLTYRTAAVASSLKEGQFYDRTIDRRRPMTKKDALNLLLWYTIGLRDPSVVENELSRYGKFH